MDVVCTADISNYLSKPSSLFLNRSVVEKLSLVQIYLNYIYIYIYIYIYRDVYSDIYNDVYSDYTATYIATFHD